MGEHGVSLYVAHVPNDGAAAEVWRSLTGVAEQLVHDGYQASVSCAHVGDLDEVEVERQARAVSEAIADDQPLLLAAAVDGAADLTPTQMAAAILNGVGVGAPRRVGAAPGGGGVVARADV